MKDLICSQIRKLNTVAVIGNVECLSAIADVVKTVFVLKADAVVKGKNIIYLADSNYLKTVKPSALVVATSFQQTLFQLQDTIYHSAPLVIFDSTDLRSEVIQFLENNKYNRKSNLKISIWKAKL